MYCEEWVERMGVDAEGPLVDMGVLFSPLLRCSSSIVFLDRRCVGSMYSYTHCATYTVYGHWHVPVATAMSCYP